MSIRIKTPEEIEKMRVAGRLAAELLDYITPFVVAGTTTEELDRLCHAYMTDVQGTIPAPLNYAPPGHSPYPKSICTSINHQICHGIPGDRKLKNGDILNIDVTVIKDGFHGDTSRMFMIGQPSVLAKRLVDVTWQCLWLGIEQVRPGAAHAWATSATSSRPMPRNRAFPSCASSAVTASVATSMRIPRCCTTGAPAPVPSWSPA